MFESGFFSNTSHGFRRIGESTSPDGSEPKLNLLSEEERLKFVERELTKAAVGYMREEQGCGNTGYGPTRGWAG